MGETCSAVAIRRTPRSSASPVDHHAARTSWKAFGDINVRKVKIRRPRAAAGARPVVPLGYRSPCILRRWCPGLIDWTSIQAMRAEDEALKDAPRRSEVASFFSAALELTKDRAVELRQDQPFSDRSRSAAPAN